MPYSLLTWPTDSHKVTQFFGDNPENYKQFNLPGHEGIDFYAPRGANVYACAAGIVSQADALPKGGPYGLQVRIEHALDAITFRTIYAHLQDVTVLRGNPVQAGDLIGHADSTGNSTGDHLHLTLEIDGAQTPGYPPGIVDPWPSLRDAGQPPEPDATDKRPGAATVHTTDYLNLRAAPTISAPILAVLPPGTALTLTPDTPAAAALIAHTVEFVEVHTPDGRIGFVAVMYLK